MRCFYHAEADAVGTCKHCHRGVCRECAAEREGGIACRGRCEAQADQVNALIQRNYQVGVKSRGLNLVAFFTFVAVFAALLYLAVEEENENVRTLLYVIAGFAFVMVPGQISVMRSWFKRRSSRQTV